LMIECVYNRMTTSVGNLCLSNVGAVPFNWPNTRSSNTYLPVDSIGFWRWCITHRITGVSDFRLALSEGPNRIGVSPHLRTETDPVSETSCLFFYLFAVYLKHNLIKRETKYKYKFVYALRKRTTEKLRCDLGQAEVDFVYVLITFLY
jgi:hypothetical protein